ELPKTARGMPMMVPTTFGMNAIGEMPYRVATRQPMAIAGNGADKIIHVDNLVSFIDTTFAGERP
ncbi:MAG TPA: hypothetical protein VF713_26580, partial [Thermoanaerobaculia bacterium]